MAEQKNFINVKIAVIVCKKKNAVSVDFKLDKKKSAIMSLLEEIAMICCGFNLHKFHLKKPAIKKAA